MLKYIVKRLLYLIPVIIGVVFIVFTLLYFAPGDPAYSALGDHASEADYEAYREEIGTNGTYLERLERYYKGLLKGDLGISYFSKKPVAEEIANRFQRTFILATTSFIVGTIIGILMGIISAVMQYSVFDWFSTVFSLIGISTPTFATGFLFIIIFAVKLRVLPASGWGVDEHLVLPVLTLGLASVGMVMRATRSSMLDALKQDYITTAKAKGQTNFSVIFKHALRNALIPIITMCSLQYINLLSGSYIAESVFAIAGSGSYMVSALNKRNYVAILGSVIILAIIAAVINLITDILYTIIDPRLRTEQLSKKSKKGSAANG